MAKWPLMLRSTHEREYAEQGAVWREEIRKYQGIAEQAVRERNEFEVDMIRALRAMRHTYASPLVSPYEDQIQYLPMPKTHHGIQEYRFRISDFMLHRMRSNPEEFERVADHVGRQIAWDLLHEKREP